MKLKADAAFGTERPVEAEAATEDARRLEALGIDIGGDELGGTAAVDLEANRVASDVDQPELADSGPAATRQPDQRRSDVIHLFVLRLGTVEQIGQRDVLQHLTLDGLDLLPGLREDLDGGGVGQCAGRRGALLR